MTAPMAGACNCLHIHATAATLQLARLQQTDTTTAAVPWSLATRSGALSKKNCIPLDKTSNTKSALVLANLRNYRKTPWPGIGGKPTRTPTPAP